MIRGEKTRYHAAWVVPITSAPIRHGWVEVDGGMITGVGGGSTQARPATGIREVQLPSTVVLPGLVNAHTHLELSRFRGAVPPAATMPSWARQMMAGQAAERPLRDEDTVREAVAELRRAGTVLVGDIANTSASMDPLAASSLEAVVFREVLGFNATCDEAQAMVAQLWADVERRSGTRIRLALAAHAPYSVAPSLFRAVSRAVVEASSGALLPMSVHLAESREEIEFLETGAGDWRAILEERGRWAPDWSPPGTGPVEYLDQLGWLVSSTLVVHGVHLTRSELNCMASAGVTLVTCPRSNQWTGAGVPPVADFYASGVRIAVGTDSLASVPDLNLFAELSELRRLAPDIPAKVLLESATRSGAMALGFGSELGAIEPFRRAVLIAVTLPGPVDDVEEYLVSGIEPVQITWFDDLED